jgi:hypothetical protein
LDECIDWRLSRHFRPHRVKTVGKVGWSGTKNGRLLRQAADEFDIFITVDRNLAFQHNLVDVDLAVIVLCASSNRLEDLLPLVPRALELIPTARPGEVALVS